MKTLIITLILVSISCAGTILAQPNTAVAPSGAQPAAAATDSTNAAPAADLEAPVIEKPAQRATGEVVPFISLGGDFPVMEAITNLAQQAGINYVLAPEMITNDVPVEVLRQPVGALRFENVTYRKALETHLAQKGLALGTRPDTHAVLLSFADDDHAPLEPEAGSI